MKSRMLARENALQILLALFLILSTQALAQDNECEARLGHANAIVKILAHALKSRATNEKLLRAFVNAKDEWSSPIDESSLTGPMFRRAFLQAASVASAEAKRDVKAKIKTLLADRAAQSARAEAASDGTRPVLSPHSFGFQAKPSQLEVYDKRARMRMSIIHGRPMFLQFRMDERQDQATYVLLDPFNPDENSREQVVSEIYAEQIFGEMDASLSALEGTFDKQLPVGTARASTISVNRIGTRVILGGATSTSGIFLEHGRPLNTIKLPEKTYVKDLAPIAFSAGTKLLGTQIYIAKDGKNGFLTIDLETGEEVSKIEVIAQDAPMAVTYVRGLPRIYIPHGAAMLSDERWYSPLLDPVAGTSAMIDVHGRATDIVSLVTRGVTYLVWGERDDVVLYDIESGLRVKFSLGKSSQIASVRQVFAFNYGGNSYVMVNRTGKDAAELFELFERAPAARANP